MRSKITSFFVAVVVATATLFAAQIYAPARLKPLANHLLDYPSALPALGYSRGLITSKIASTPLTSRLSLSTRSRVVALLPALPTIAMIKDDNGGAPAASTDTSTKTAKDKGEKDNGVVILPGKGATTVTQVVDQTRQDIYTAQYGGEAARYNYNYATGQAATTAEWNDPKAQIAGTYVAPNGKRYNIGGSGAADTAAASNQFALALGNKLTTLGNSQLLDAAKVVDPSGSKACASTDTTCQQNLIKSTVITIAQNSVAVGSLSQENLTNIANYQQQNAKAQEISQKNLEAFLNPTSSLESLTGCTGDRCDRISLETYVKNSIGITDPAKITEYLNLRDQNVDNYKSDLEKIKLYSDPKNTTADIAKQVCGSDVDCKRNFVRDDYLNSLHYSDLAAQAKKQYSANQMIIKYLNTPNEALVKEYCGGSADSCERLISGGLLKAAGVDEVTTTTLVTQKQATTFLNSYKLGDLGNIKVDSPNYLDLYNKNLQECIDVSGELAAETCKRAAKVNTDKDLAELAAKNQNNQVDYLAQYQKVFDGCIKRAGATSTGCDTYATKSASSAVAQSSAGAIYVPSVEDANIKAGCIALGGDNCSTKTASLDYLSTLTNDPSFTAANIEAQKNLYYQNLKSEQRITSTLQNNGQYDKIAQAVASGETTWVEAETALKELRKDWATDTIIGWNDFTSGRFRYGNNKMLNATGGNGNFRTMLSIGFSAFTFGAVKADTFGSMMGLENHIDSWGYVTGGLIQGGDAAMVATAAVGAPLAAIPLGGAAAGVGALGYLGTGLGIAGSSQMVGTAAYTCDQIGQNNITQADCNSSIAMATISIAGTGLGVAGQSIQKVTEGAQVGALTAELGNLGKQSALVGKTVSALQLGVSGLSTVTFTDMAVKTCSQPGVTSLDCNSSIMMAVAAATGFAGSSFQSWNNGFSTFTELASTAKIAPTIGTVSTAMLESAPHVASSALFALSACSKLKENINADTTAMCAFGLSGVAQTSVDIISKASSGEPISPVDPAKLAESSKLAETKKLTGTDRLMTVQEADTIIKQFEVIKNTKPYENRSEILDNPQGRENLAKYAKEIKGVNEADIARQIIDNWNKNDGVDHFQNPDQVSRALVYAQEVARIQKEALANPVEQLATSLTDLHKQGEIDVPLHQAEGKTRIDIARLESPESKAVASKINAQIDALERIEGAIRGEPFVISKEQVQDIVSSKQVIQLKAQDGTSLKGKTAVIERILTTIEARSFVMLENITIAETFINTAVLSESGKQFYGEAGSKIIFINTENGGFSLVDMNATSFKAGDGIKLSAQEVRALLEKSKAGTEKLVFVTDYANGSWERLQGNEIQKPPTLWEKLTGTTTRACACVVSASPEGQLMKDIVQGNEGKFMVLGDEISANITGQYSTSGSSIDLVKVTDKSQLGGAKSGKEALKIHHEAVEANQEIAAQRNTELQSGIFQSKYFTQVESNSIPVDGSLHARTMADLIDQSMSKTRSVDAQVKKDFLSIAERLRNPSLEGGGEKALPEFEALIAKNPGSTLVRDLNLRRASVQADWNQLARIPGTEFAQEGNNLALRKDNFTSGERLSSTSELIAFHERGIEMLESAKKSDAGRSLYFDRSVLPPSERIQISPKGSSLALSELIVEMIQNGHTFKGLDSTPHKAIHTLNLPDTPIETVIKPRTLSTAKTTGDALEFFATERATSYPDKIAVLAIDRNVPQVDLVLENAVALAHKQNAGFDTIILAQNKKSTNGLVSEEFIEYKVKDGKILYESKRIIPGGAEGWNREILAIPEASRSKLMLAINIERALDLTTSIKPFTHWTEFYDTTGKTKPTSVNQEQLWRRDRTFEQDHDMIMVTELTNLTRDNVQSYLSDNLNLELAQTRFQNTISALGKAPELALQSLDSYLSANPPKLNFIQKIRWNNLRSELVQEVSGHSNSLSTAISRTPLEGKELLLELYRRGESTNNKILDMAERISGATKIPIETVREKLLVKDTFISESDFFAKLDLATKSLSKAKSPAPSDILLSFAENNSTSATSDPRFHVIEKYHIASSNTTNTQVNSETVSTTTKTPTLFERIKSTFTSSNSQSTPLSLATRNELAGSLTRLGAGLAAMSRPFTNTPSQAQQSLTLAQRNLVKIQQPRNTDIAVTDAELANAQAAVQQAEFLVKNGYPVSLPILNNETVLDILTNPGSEMGFITNDNRVLEFRNQNGQITFSEGGSTPEPVSITQALNLLPRPGSISLATRGSQNFDPSAYRVAPATTSTPTNTSNTLITATKQAAQGAIATLTNTQARPTVLNLNSSTVSQIESSFESLQTNQTINIDNNYSITKLDIKEGSSTGYKLTDKQTGQEYFVKKPSRSDINLNNEQNNFNNLSEKAKRSGLINPILYTSPTGSFQITLYYPNLVEGRLLLSSVSQLELAQLSAQLTLELAKVGVSISGKDIRFSTGHNIALVQENGVNKLILFDHGTYEASSKPYQQIVEDAIINAFEDIGRYGFARDSSSSTLNAASELLVIDQTIKALINDSSVNNITIPHIQIEKYINPKLPKINTFVINANDYQSNLLFDNAINAVKQMIDYVNTNYLVDKALFTQILEETGQELLKAKQQANSIPQHRVAGISLPATNLGTQTALSLRSFLSPKPNLPGCSDCSKEIPGIMRDAVKAYKSQDTDALRQLLKHEEYNNHILQNSVNSVLHLMLANLSGLSIDYETSINAVNEALKLLEAYSYTPKPSEVDFTPIVSPTLKDLAGTIADIVTPVLTTLPIEGTHGASNPAAHVQALESMRAYSQQKVGSRIVNFPTPVQITPHEIDRDIKIRLSAFGKFITPHFKNNGTLLDFGTGSGKLARALASQNNQRLLQADNVDRRDIKDNNYIQLPLKDLPVFDKSLEGTIDNILLLVDVLHNVLYQNMSSFDSKIAVLTELSKLLAPDGKIFIVADSGTATGEQAISSFVEIAEHVQDDINLKNKIIFIKEAKIYTPTVAVSSVGTTSSTSNAFTLKEASPTKTTDRILSPNQTAFAAGKAAAQTLKSALPFTPSTNDANPNLVAPDATRKALKDMLTAPSTTPNTDHWIEYFTRLLEIQNGLDTTPEDTITTYKKWLERLSALKAANVDLPPLNTATEAQANFLDQAKVEEILLTAEDKILQTKTINRILSPNQTAFAAGQAAASTLKSALPFTRTTDQANPNLVAPDTNTQALKDMLKPPSTTPKNTISSAINDFALAVAINRGNFDLLNEAITILAEKVGVDTSTIRKYLGQIYNINPNDIDGINSALYNKALNPNGNNNLTQQLNRQLENNINPNNQISTDIRVNTQVISHTKDAILALLSQASKTRKLIQDIESAQSKAEEDIDSYLQSYSLNNNIYTLNQLTPISTSTRQKLGFNSYGQLHQFQLDVIKALRDQDLESAKSAINSQVTKLKSNGYKVITLPETEFNNNMVKIGGVVDNYEASSWGAFVHYSQKTVYLRQPANQQTTRELIERIVLIAHELGHATDDITKKSKTPISHDVLMARISESNQQYFSGLAESVLGNISNSLTYFTVSQALDGAQNYKESGIETLEKNLTVNLPQFKQSQSPSTNQFELITIGNKVRLKYTKNNSTYEIPVESVPNNIWQQTINYYQSQYYHQNSSDCSSCIPKVYQTTVAGQAAKSTIDINRALITLNDHTFERTDPQDILNAYLFYQKGKITGQKIYFDQSITYMQRALTKIEGAIANNAIKSGEENLELPDELANLAEPIKLLLQNLPITGTFEAAKVEDYPTIIRSAIDHVKEVSKDKKTSLAARVSHPFFIARLAANRTLGDIFDFNLDLGNFSNVDTSNLVSFSDSDQLLISAKEIYQAKKSIEIGRGKYGAIHKVTINNKNYAMKIFLDTASDANIIKELEFFSKYGGQASLPNYIGSGFLDSGTTYYLSEYIEGETLESIENALILENTKKTIQQLTDLRGSNRAEYNQLVKKYIAKYASASDEDLMFEAPTANDLALEVVKGYVPRYLTTEQSQDFIDQINNFHLLTGRPHLDTKLSNFILDKNAGKIRILDPDLFNVNIETSKETELSSMLELIRQRSLDPERLHLPKNQQTDTSNSIQSPKDGLNVSVKYATYIRDNDGNVIYGIPENTTITDLGSTQIIKGFDIKTRQPVAIKRTNKFYKDIQKEAENLRKLDHPNIPKLLYVSGDNAVLVTKWIDDPTAENIDIVSASERYTQVAQALDHAHSQNINHLDLKPRNILGNYLIDWGNQTIKEDYPQNDTPAKDRIDFVKSLYQSITGINLFIDIDRYQKPSNISILKDQLSREQLEGLDAYFDSILFTKHTYTTTSVLIDEFTKIIAPSTTISPIEKPSNAIGAFMNIQGINWFYDTVIKPIDYRFNQWIQNNQFLKVKNYQIRMIIEYYRNIKPIIKASNKFTDERDESIIFTLISYPEETNPAIIPYIKLWIPHIDYLGDIWTILQKITELPHHNQNIDQEIFNIITTELSSRGLEESTLPRKLENFIQEQNNLEYRQQLGTIPTYLDHEDTTSRLWETIINYAVKARYDQDFNHYFEIYNFKMIYPDEWSSMAQKYPILNQMLIDEEQIIYEYEQAIIRAKEAGIYYFGDIENIFRNRTSDLLNNNRKQILTILQPILLDLLHGHIPPMSTYSYGYLSPLDNRHILTILAEISDDATFENALRYYLSGINEYSGNQSESKYFHTIRSYLTGDISNLSKQHNIRTTDSNRYLQTNAIFQQIPDDHGMRTFWRTVLDNPILIDHLSTLDDNPNKEYLIKTIELFPSIDDWIFVLKNQDLFLTKVEATFKSLTGNPETDRALISSLVNTGKDIYINYKRFVSNFVNDTHLPETEQDYIYLDNYLQQIDKSYLTTNYANLAKHFKIKNWESKPRPQVLQEITNQLKTVSLTPSEYKFQMQLSTISYSIPKEKGESLTKTLKQLPQVIDPQQVVDSLEEQYKIISDQYIDQLVALPSISVKQEVEQISSRLGLTETDKATFTTKLTGIVNANRELSIDEKISNEVRTLEKKPTLTNSTLISFVRSPEFTDLLSSSTTLPNKEFTSKLTEIARQRLPNADQKNIDQFITTLKGTITRISRVTSLEDRQGILETKKTSIRKLLVSYIPINTDQLSYVFHELSRLADADNLFDKYTSNTKMTPEEISLFITKIESMITGNLEEFIALHPNLSDIQTTLESTNLWKDLKQIVANKQVTDQKIESSLSDMTLILTNRTLLDIWQGKVSHTCFGDHPEHLSKRDNVVPVRMLKNGELFGNALFLIQPSTIKGGKIRFILIGFDPSESFASAVNEEKMREFVNLSMQGFKALADQNNWELMIGEPEEVGGLSNRGSIIQSHIMENYASTNSTPIIPEAKLQPNYGYTPKTAHQLSQIGTAKLDNTTNKSKTIPPQTSAPTSQPPYSPIAALALPAFAGGGGPLVALSTQLSSWAYNAAVTSTATLSPYIGPFTPNLPLLTVNVKSWVQNISLLPNFLGESLWGGRTLQKLIGLGVMAATLVIVTATVIVYSIISNPTISQPTLTLPPPTQITQTTQIAPTQIFTQIPTQVPSIVTATPEVNPIPQDAPPMALRIIDNTHPITQAEVESNIEPNLVLISEADPSIRNVNPARIRADKTVIPALAALYKAAEIDRVNLSIRSAYRSYEDQARSSSQATDKTTVVLPGYSQHHSGLAIDFTTIDIGYVVDKNAYFEDTKAGKWLAEHAWEYGLIPAYTANHQGISNESWHYIYVGNTLAKEWHSSQSTDAPLDYFALVEQYHTSSPLLPAVLAGGTTIGTTIIDAAYNAAVSATAVLAPFVGSLFPYLSDVSMTRDLIHNINLWWRNRFAFIPNLVLQTQNLGFSLSEQGQVMTPSPALATSILASLKPKSKTSPLVFRGTPDIAPFYLLPDMPKQLRNNQALPHINLLALINRTPQELFARLNQITISGNQKITKLINLAESSLAIMFNKDGLAGMGGVNGSHSMMTNFDGVHADIKTQNIPLPVGEYNIAQAVITLQAQIAGIKNMATAIEKEQYLSIKQNNSYTLKATSVPVLSRTVRLSFSQEIGKWSFIDISLEKLSSLSGEQMLRLAGILSNAIIVDAQDQQDFGQIMPQDQWYSELPGSTPPIAAIAFSEVLAGKADHSEPIYQYDHRIALRSIAQYQHLQKQNHHSWKLYDMLDQAAHIVMGGPAKQAMETIKETLEANNINTLAIPVHELVTDPIIVKDKDMELATNNPLSKQVNISSVTTQIRLDPSFQAVWQKAREKWNNNLVEPIPNLFAFLLAGSETAGEVGNPIPGYFPVEADSPNYINTGVAIGYSAAPISRAVHNITDISIDELLSELTFQSKIIKLESNREKDATTPSFFLAALNVSLDLLHPAARGITPGISDASLSVFQVSNLGRSKSSPNTTSFNTAAPATRTPIGIGILDDVISIKNNGSKELWVKTILELNQQDKNFNTDLAKALKESNFANHDSVALFQQIIGSSDPVATYRHLTAIAYLNANNKKLIDSLNDALLAATAQIRGDHLDTLKQQYIKNTEIFTLEYIANLYQVALYLDSHNPANNTSSEHDSLSSALKEIQAMQQMLENDSTPN